MKISKLKFNVDMRDEQSTAMQISTILKDLAYKSSNLNSVAEIYKIDKSMLDTKGSLEYITQQVRNKNQSTAYYLERKINELKQEINKIQDTYLEDVGKVLDLDFEDEREAFCYLQFIPMNEINFQYQNINLECKDSARDMLRELLILETKIYIIRRFKQIIPAHYYFDYEGSNRMWMFAEFCVDAVVSNSNLNKYIPNPAYKFFYSLKIDGVNVLEAFRQLFPKISLAQFLVQVFSFVRDNYNTIAEFKNYLY